MSYPSFFENIEAYAFWHSVNDKTLEQISRLNKHAGQVMLDAGCGAGDETARMDMDKYPARLVAFDKSSSALPYYKTNNPTAEMHLDSIENYAKNCKIKFDLILFSQSLYNVKVDEVMDDYKNLLAQGGKILVFQDSDKGNIVQLRKKYWNEVHGTPFNETSAEDVQKTLNNCITKVINYNVLLDELQRNDVTDTDFTKKLIPFFMKSKDINHETEIKILDDIYKRSIDDKMPSVTHELVYQK